MRVVIDTNIFVSYLLTPSNELARAVADMLARHTILVSQETWAELTEVLARPRIARLLDQARVTEFLLHLRQFAEDVAVTTEVRICRDRKDDKFLSLAASGRADCVISGDLDLREMTAFQGIPIFSVAAFSAWETR